MTRNPQRPQLVCIVIAASLAALACSSSSGGNTPVASGGSAGQAGMASAQGGVSAQGGSGAEAGTTALGGGGAAGATSVAGTTGTAGSVGQAGSAGTGSADPCKTALFCDDFEAFAAGSPPGAPWSNNMSGGTVAVDTTHARSGTRAVKMTATAVSETATSHYRSAMIKLQRTSFLPPAGTALYGRMMFWLDSAPTASVHWTFVDAWGLVPGQTYHAYYRYGGQLPISNGATFVGSQLMANYDTPDSYAMPMVGPSSDCWQHSDKTVVPVAAWTCAEWKFDGAGNKMQFWLNGSEITSLAVSGTGQGCVNQPGTFPWSAPTFERIEVGWESYQADDARTIWIDDLALSTTKIGCPQ